MKWTDPDIEHIRAVRVDLPGSDDPGWERLALLNRIHRELDQGLLRIRHGRIERREPDSELRELLARHTDIAAAFIALHEEKS